MNRKDIKIRYSGELALEMRIAALEKALESVLPMARACLHVQSASQGFDGPGMVKSLKEIEHAQAVLNAL